MPIAYPASPTTNQTYAYGGRTYRWTGAAWEFVAASGGGEDALLRSIFVPAAPTGLTVAAGNAQATLSWTAPTGVIALAPITDYREQYSTDNGTTWTTFTAAASTATTATVTGLQNNQAVRFRVAAVNAVGVGAYTSASSAVTPTIPSDVDFGNVSLLLHMDGTGNTFVDSSATPKTITANGNATQSAAQSQFGGKSALFNGESDGLTVPNSAALNLAGVDWAIEAWLHPTSTPQYTCVVGKRSFSEPTSYYIYMTNGVMGFYTGSVFSTSTTIPTNQWTHIAWSMASGTLRAYVGGAKVNEWSAVTIQEVDVPITIGRHFSSLVERFVGYIDDLRITKGSHRGYTGETITVPTAAFPDAGPMLAPTALSATGGNAQVSLTWTAPSYNGGSAITDYAVQYSTNSGSTWTSASRTASTTASQVVSSLTNGTAYVFRVAAINANGTGTYTTASSSVTPTAPTPPNAPTSLTATAGNAQIALAWTAPSAPGTSAITGYTVEYTPSGGSAQTVSTGSTGTSYTLTGLTNGTAYTVRVRAVSASGDGTYTAASSSVTPSGVLFTLETGQYILGSGTSGNPYRVSQNSGPNIFVAQQNATIYWSGMDQSGEWDEAMYYWSGFQIRKNGTGTPSSATDGDGFGAGVNAWSGSVLVASTPSSGSVAVNAGDRISIATEIRRQAYFGLSPDRYPWQMIPSQRIWFVAR
jgi:hypothetical protein